MTDKKDKAYEDYVKGMKYADIAVKYGVTVSAVKQWARRDWNKQNVTPCVTLNEKVTSEKVTEVTTPPPRQRGGANNVTHGAYENVSWDVLEEDEHGLINDIDYSPEAILRGNLKNLLLRERRLLLKIQKIEQESENGKKPVLDKITKMRETFGKINDEDKDQNKNVTNKTITEATAAHNVRRIYEAELTKIQAQKIRCASELAKLLKIGNDGVEGKTKISGEIKIDISSLSNNEVSLLEQLIDKIAPD